MDFITEILGTKTKASTKFFKKREIIQKQGFVSKNPPLLTWKMSEVPSVSPLLSKCHHYPPAMSQYLRAMESLSL